MFNTIASTVALAAISFGSPIGDIIHTIENLLHPTTTASAPVTSGNLQLVQYPNANGFNDYYAKLAQAKKSIAIEVYSMNDRKLEDTLIAAKNRGVNVQVMLDSAFNGSSFNHDAYAYLTSNKVSVKWAPTGYIYHIKTTVIDNNVAIVSTANLNDKNYANTRDASIITTNTAQVNAIAQTFAKDWTLQGKPVDHTVNAPGLLWSPGAEPGMVSAITAAKTSIRYSSEELASDDVVNALASDAKRGVKCDVLMTYEKTWDADYAKLRSAGCKLHLITKSTKNIYIHEKIVLTDNSNLLIGSQNASDSSLNRNRELSIILNKSNASNIISSVASTFDSDTRYATKS